MSGQAGVLTRQNAALISDELLEQIGVFEIEGLDGKIDFRFGARSAHLHKGTSAAGTAFIGFFGAGFAWHRVRLLDFAVERVAAQSGIVLPELELFGFEFLIARGGIAGR